MIFWIMTDQESKTVSTSRSLETSNENYHFLQLITVTLFNNRHSSSYSPADACIIAAVAFLLTLLFCSKAAISVPLLRNLIPFAVAVLPISAMYLFFSTYGYPAIITLLRNSRVFVLCFFSAFAYKVCLMGERRFSSTF